MPTRSGPLCALVVLFLVAGGAFGQAALTWNGSIDTDWNTPANWTPAQVPTILDDVTVPNLGAGPYPGVAGVTVFARDLAINGGGRVNVDNFGVVEVGRNVTLVGRIRSIASGDVGTLRLTGPDHAFLNSITTSTHDVRLDVAKTGGTATLSALAFNGGLTSTNSAVDIVAGASASFGNNGSFIGGSFQSGDDIAFLDIPGSLTFSGTVVTGTAAILCAGDFTADAAFAPTAGGVFLVGTNPKSVNNSGVFFDLSNSGSGAATILAAATAGTFEAAFNATSTSLAPGVVVAVGGDLRLHGGTISVADAAARFDVAGSVDSTIDATITGLFNARCAGDWSTAASFAPTDGTVVFDGAGPATISAAGSFFDVVVEGPGAKTFDDALIAGALTTTGGALVVSAGATISVAGSAAFSGGAISCADSTAAVDVAGTTVFSGATAGLLNLFAAGDVSVDAAFAPTGGATTLDGGVVQQISGVGVFADVAIVGGGAKTAIGLSATGAVDVGAGGALVAGGPFAVGGDLFVDAAATFDDGGFDVAVGGDLTLPAAAALAGTTILDGASSATVDFIGAFQNVRVAKTGGAAVAFDGATSVLGFLDVQSGVATSATLDVDGATTIGAGASLGVAGATALAGDLTVVGVFTVGGSLTFDGGVAVASAASLPGFTVVKPGASLTLGPTVVAGAVSIQSGSLIAAGALDVAGAFASDPLATFDAGAFVHDFRAALLLDGTTAATGVFRFSAPPAGLFAPTITARCASGFPNVAVAAPGRVVGFGSSGAAAINGAFTASSGTAAWFGPTTVAGTATISGGTLFVSAASSVALAFAQTSGSSNFSAPTSLLGGATFSGGTFVASAQVTIAGPTVFNGGVATGAASIRALGDWTSGGLFNPASGVVKLDGGGAPQTLFGAPVFFGLTIAPGAIVATNATVRTKGQATIAGAFATTGAFDADGAFSVVSGGAFDGGGGTHTFAGAFQTVAGGLTFASGARCVFDGTGATTPLSPDPLPTIETAKSGGSVLLQNLAISGDLVLTSGATTTGAAVSVVGSLFANGGSLTALDPTQPCSIGGHATFAGATAIAPALDVALDFTSDAAFAPTGGVVRCVGGASRNIAGFGSFGGASLTLAGGTTSAATAIDVGGAFRIEAPATFDAGGATHMFSGDFVCLGSLSGGGVFQFGGGGVRTLATTAPLPAVVVAKTPGATLRVGDAAVATATSCDALLAQSGRFVVGAGTTCAVTADATFSGGAFATESGASLDVGGATTFSGATATEAADLFVGGAFDSDAGFQPSAGAVVFDGAGLQTATLAPPGGFRNLVVSATSSVQLQGTAPLVRGTTTIDGILQSGGSASFRGAFVVGATGEFDGGDVVHNFGGDVSAFGQITHVLTMIADGDSAATFGSVGAAPALDVQKGPLGSLQLGGALPFAVASLTLTSGFAFVPSSSVAVVAGTASFLGGSFASQAVSAVLQIDGDAAFASCDVSGIASLDCGGALTVDSNFAPTSGLVRFIGPGSSTLASDVFGGTIVLPDLSIAAGTTSIVSDATIVADSVSIAAGAALRIAGAVAQFAPTNFAISGEVFVDVGGTLGLSDGAPLLIPPTASLRLIGDPLAPATIAGTGPNGCDVRVQGALAARNFRVLDVATTGFLVDVTATLAAAPDDLRGGLFSGPRAGGVLLDVRRSHPTAATVDFRYLAFENPSGAPGASNVRSPFGTPLSMTNFSGAFGGEAFDDDPQNRITWSAPQQTTLAGMTLIPGASVVTASFATSAEFDAEAFVLDRREPPGAFAFVDETQAIGVGGAGAAYQIVDATVLSGTSYEYRLSARLTHGAIVQLDVQSVATIMLTGGSSGVFAVGPGRGHATPQDAVDAAVGLGFYRPVLLLDPGVHPAFSITTTPPGGLRVIGLPGTIIDASGAPLLVQGTGVGAVELRDLSIVSSGAAGPAVVVGGTSSIVLFESCSIDGGAAAGVAAATVVGLSLQNCAVLGTPGLVSDQNAVVSIAGGTVGGIDAAGGAIVRSSAATLGATTTTGGALLSVYGGALARTTTPAATLLGAPCLVSATWTPSAPWMLFASLGLSYMPPAAPFEMPVYLDVATILPLASGSTGASGAASFTFVTPPAPFLVGYSVSFQTAFLDGATGAIRVSTVSTTTVSG